MRYFSVIFLILLAVAPAGAAGTEPDTLDDVVSGPDVTEPSLPVTPEDGHWSGPDCELSKSWKKDLKQGLYISAFDHTFEKLFNIYHTKDEPTHCEKLALIISEEYTYTSKPSATVPGGLEIDATLNEKMITPLDDKIAAELNKEKYLGITKWKAMQPVLYKPKKKTVEYKLIQIQDGKWYDGDSGTGNGTSPSTRPKKIDTSRFYQGETESH